MLDSLRLDMDRQDLSNKLSFCLDSHIRYLENFPGRGKHASSYVVPAARVSGAVVGVRTRGDDVRQGRGRHVRPHRGPVIRECVPRCAVPDFGSTLEMSPISGTGPIIWVIGPVPLVLRDRDCPCE